MSSCYTAEEKLYAVSLVRDHRMTYRQALGICGISRTHICRMVHDLGGRPGRTRGPARDDPARKGAAVPDLRDLPDDPDELKRIIFDLQFEIDLKEAVVGILKKDPGARLEGPGNREKALLVSALAEKGTIRLDGWRRISGSHQRLSTITGGGWGRIRRGS